MQIQLNFSGNTRSLEIPATWNDLITEDNHGNRQPAKAIALLELLQGPGDLTQKRISAMTWLLELTPQEIQDWKIDRAIEHGADWQTVFFSEIDALLESTSFLLEALPEEEAEDNFQKRYQLNTSLTKCPIPVLRGMPGNFSKTYDLYAPADELENVSALELALLFDLYETYTRTREVKYVDQLIATLYRKSKAETEEQLEENWHGDRRQPYNEATVGSRQQQIAKLPPMVKNIIFFWFLSCRLHIIAQFPAIFKEADGRERQGADYGWWGIFRQVSGNLINTEAIAKLNFRDVLTELDFLETERLKKEMQRNFSEV